MEDPLSSSGVSVLPSSSSMRLWALGVVALISGVLMVAIPSDAEACSPAGAFSIPNVEDDTPECVEYLRTFDTGVNEGLSLEVEHDCDGPLRMEALECADCQEEIVVYPPGELPEEYESDGEGNIDGEDGEYDVHVESPAMLVVDDREAEELETGRVYDYHYGWEVDDQEGTYIAEAEYNGDGPRGDCDTLCSATPESPPTSFIVVLVLFGIAALGRRIDASSEVET